MDLRGDRVTLRAQREEDAPRYAAILADFETVRFLAQWSRPPAGTAEEVAYLRTQRPSECRWAIETSATHALLGACGVDVDTVSRRADFGIFVGPPSEWGKGYGSEACRLVVAYAFHHLNLRKVALYTYEGNERAQRVYERCGFAVEARVPNHTWLNGGYVGHIQMGVYSDNPLYLTPP